MATERFQKLSQDKKDRILQAARHEFARVPFEDASINRMIKDAGISRGSFYTYFTDKLDLLHYVFQDEDTRNEQYFRELILRKQGNYWEAIREWVHTVSDMIRAGRVQEDIHIFTQSGMMQRVFAYSESSERDQLNQQNMEWMQKEIDSSCFRRSTCASQFANTLQLGNAIAMMAILALIGHSEAKHAEILQSFETKLAILREGADPHFHEQ
ncbi:MAG TPA: hypothetical protein DIW34_07215 [Oribacterium sp.]|nr:hypothetical protein [Oribacterium sp.]